MKKNIAIIGAGPGGLTVALLLAHQGHQVTLFEAQSVVGGRSSPITLGDYRFDAGPTFFIYRPILDEVFHTIGKKLDDVVNLMPVEPLYDLVFSDKVFTPYSNGEKMLKAIQEHFPEDVEGYRRYRIQEAKRLKKITPILQSPFSSLLSYLSPKVLNAFSELDLGKSLYDRLKTYFKNEQLIYSMAFQAKYLGMSPYEAPSLFSILSFMEHEYGLYHIQGGLFHLNQVMAKLAQSMGVKIKLNHRLKETKVVNKKVTELVFDNGHTERPDLVVFNGDFANIMHTIEGRHRPTYRDKKLASLKYSCSTFNFYLGLDTQYDLKHHTIVFSKDYPGYLKTLQANQVLTEDVSYYVHNPTILDPSLAPKGHSTLFVLVPVPNLKAPIDWEKEKESYYEKILSHMEKTLPLPNLRQHIKAKKIISPLDWQKDYFVEYGANFNLAHSLDQMLYFRPHNQFNDVKNLFLVGGGTHPGSGLPTIYQSSLITAKLIKY